MVILEVQIDVRDLRSAHDFYAGCLGFPELETRSDRVILAAGSSRLVLRQADVRPEGVYHLAFNIPENQFEPSLNWLQERTELLCGANGQTVFPFESWDAHAVYFTDPDGNILELIARHSLVSSRRETFEILSLSEVGVSVDNVDTEATRLGLPDYKNRSESFRPLGDEEGLLILVKSGRIWWPTESAVAAPLPLELTLSNRSGPPLILRFGPPSLRGGYPAAGCEGQGGFG